MLFQMFVYVGGLDVVAKMVLLKGLLSRLRFLLIIQDSSSWAGSSWIPPSLLDLEYFSVVFCILDAIEVFLVLGAIKGHFCFQLVAILFFFRCFCFHHVLFK